MIWKWSESKMYMNLFDSHVHSEDVYKRQPLLECGCCHRQLKARTDAVGHQRPVDQRLSLILERRFQTLRVLAWNAGPGNPLADVPLHHHHRTAVDLAAHLLDNLLHPAVQEVYKRQPSGPSSADRQQTPVCPAAGRR